MPTEEINTRPNILYSCYVNTSREGEQFVADNVFSYVISGSMEIYVKGKTHFINPGDYRFLAKNQLAKFTKHVPKGGEFKTISIIMDKETLRTVSEDTGIKS